jgi:GAF domain-containing protein
MKCARCHQDNPSHAKFCLECGTPADGVATSYAHLKDELERLRSSLTESLEQQTATSEILRVIASSPTDLEPVMQAVVENAARVCGAMDSSIFRLEGEHLRLMARHGPLRISYAIGESVPVRRDTVGGRVIHDRRTIHVEDILAAEAEFPVTVSRGRAGGSTVRTMAATPLLREGRPLGVLYINRGPEVQPFSPKQIALLETFANQAVIAIENVRLFKELETRNRDLTESLEQQTATASVLRAISGSPMDTRPVFEMIAESAARLCEAHDTVVRRAHDGHLEVAAIHGSIPTMRQPIHRALPSGRAFLDGETVHVLDFAAELASLPEELAENRASAAEAEIRTVLAVPLLREGAAIGIIAIRRRVVRPFTDKQIALVKTFADQAVIAIENVRLFQELQARNRDLTATSEILRVIAGSPTDLQPVFDTIAERSMRLCEATFCWVLTFDGELMHLGSLANVSPEGADALRQVLPQAPSRGTAAGRTILTGDVVQVPDVLADPEYELKGTAQATNYRSVLTVPLLHQGHPIGVIAVSRPEPRGFSAEQIQLLTTFADQAVIAIENVRLFNETKEALERQTATADILRVISSSPTDLQPVFDVIVQSAVRLCDGLFAALFRFDGELIHFAAQHNFTPEGIEAVRRTFPVHPTRALGSGRAILRRAVVHIPDVEVDPEYAHQAMSHAVGFRSGLWVPMMREGAPIGVIAVVRAEPGPFSDNQIELLKTFADQAVIAIENVRLFTELQARTRELGRSVDELKALGEVGRAVSSTLDLETVLNTIVSRAAQLAGADGASIHEYDEASREFPMRATHNYDPELVESYRAMPIRMGEGLTGRAAERREPMQVPDIAPEGAYQSHLRALLLRMGYRALLSVPLVREDQVIGALVVNRQAPGEFPPEVVELLKTFATQSALAIQNARLFREIADKSRQLEAASRHKSEFLANMSHELRTPLNAIIGFSEVLGERMFGDVNEKQAEYLQDILASGRHLLSLINDILDLSKVEAGRLELELDRFHLPTALDNALTLLRERATRHGITLTQTVDEKVGDIVADERKVKQILLNLLSNAVKFTPEGGRVGVTATVADGVITISVSDTGIGIAPEDQAAIFEEFRQVGRDDARKQEGTGLGLTLAKKFVELQGGQIWVQSQVGQGSTFTFTLPVRGEGGSASDRGGGASPPP